MATKGTSILICNCQHDYQDKTYGNGKRLHVAMQNGQWRCTVCGKTTGAASKVPATQEKK